ncbi:MAG: [FeFe] hydrogenase H-cluster radical SAM maturase HydG [Thermodesulfobacteriota bacterium]
MDNCIPVDEIHAILERTEDAPLKDVEAVIGKGRALKGLDPEAAAILLQCTDREVVDEIYHAAQEVKESVYGKRLVLFAPLYLSNVCANSCLYCGFRRENRRMRRRVLTSDEIRQETEALIEEGHKRILLVAGEDPEQSGIDYIERAIGVVYSTKTDGGEIRRVNVNVAPLTVEGLRRLKSAGIGTYQLFQESYHLPTYKKMHPRGAKADYTGRLSALDRAQEAGIDDVGMGVLFGLYDYRFEVLALIYHARHLEDEFGVGPHTISVPRIEPAPGAPLSKSPPHGVSDEDFRRLIAVLRLAVPYTGMILSTREEAGFRDTLLHLGISQISASSKTTPGGYTGGDRDDECGQFSVGDRRTTAEVIRNVSIHGFTPSFCTACYRVGRTGEEFMDHAKPGHIHRFCVPNSLLTFKEYLLDFGDDELCKVGDSLIRKELSSMGDRGLQRATIKKLRELEEGKRDLFF